VDQTNFSRHLAIVDALREEGAKWLCHVSVSASKSATYIFWCGAALRGLQGDSTLRGPFLGSVF